MPWFAQDRAGFCLVFWHKHSSILFYSQKRPGVSDYTVILTGSKTGIPGRGNRTKKGTGRKCLVPSGNHIPALGQAVTSFFLSTAFSDHGPEVLVHARGVSGGREGILLLCECTVLMDARLGVASEQSRGTQGLRMQQPSVGGRAARQL